MEAQYTYHRTQSLSTGSSGGPLTTYPKLKISRRNCLYFPQPRLFNRNSKYFPQRHASHTGGALTLQLLSQPNLHRLSALLSPAGWSSADPSWWSPDFPIVWLTLIVLILFFSLLYWHQCHWARLSLYLSLSSLPSATPGSASILSSIHKVLWGSLCLGCSQHKPRTTLCWEPTNSISQTLNGNWTQLASLMTIDHKYGPSAWLSRHVNLNWERGWSDYYLMCAASLEGLFNDIKSGLQMLSIKTYLYTLIPMGWFRNPLCAPRSGAMTFRQKPCRNLPPPAWVSLADFCNPPN